MKRFVHRGGNYNNTSNAGPRYSNANYRPSNPNAFRLVFIDRQLHNLYGDYASAFDKKSLIPSSIEENNNRWVRPVGFARPPYLTAYIMKTYNNLWNEIISFENLLLAYRKAAKKKYYRRSVLSFSENLEENLIQIQNELIWHEYVPSPAKKFIVYEPKERHITAPAFRDRVVQHALCSVIEPLIDRRFIYDSYACRIGKGNLAVVQRLQDLEKKAAAEYGAFYCYNGDIKSFFLSIPTTTLKTIIRKVIYDKNALWLIDLFLDSGELVGIIIGALLSQLSANLYLDSLDHLVKDYLGYPYYVRYMDNFAIITKTAKEAQAAGDTVIEFIGTMLGLEINHKSFVLKGSSGINFCGFRVWPSHIKPLKPTFKRSVRRLKKKAKLYNEGKLSIIKFRQSLMSYLGHYKHCDARRSIESALNKIVLIGGQK